MLLRSSSSARSALFRSSDQNTSCSVRISSNVASEILMTGTMDASSATSDALTTPMTTTGRPLHRLARRVANQRLRLCQ